MVFYILNKKLIEYKISFRPNDNNQLENLFDYRSLCTFLLFNNRLKLKSVRQHPFALFTNFPGNYL